MYCVVLQITADIGITNMRELVVNQMNLKEQSS